MELLAFVEVARYDEATNIMTVRQDTGLPDLDDELNRVLAAMTKEGSFKEQVPAKLFQTETAVACLFKVRQPMDSTPNYIMLRSDVASVPQILQRTTATIIAQALMLTSVCRWRGAQRAKVCMRLVCSDRYKAQFGAERLLTSCRPKWWRLHLGCEIHMSTASQAKGLLLVDRAIAGTIRLALSLRLGGWMRIFRQCMLEEILETLDIQEGSCSEDAAAHRKACLMVFLGAGSRRRQMQGILSCLPNGDWRLTDRVQVYLRAGAAHTREQVAVLVAKGLLHTLAGTAVRIFNRKRWTNNDLAINQLGLLQCCHGLLRRVYTRWLVACGYKGSLTAGREGSCDEVAPLLPLAFDAAQVAGLGLGLDSEVEAQPVEQVDPVDADGDGHREAESSDAKRVEDDSFAEQNARNRLAALTWLNGEPLAELLVVRLVMEPSMAVLRRQLAIASDRWERQQASKALPGDGGLGGRDFRILVSARGDLDAQFIRHHQMLANATTLWKVMPSSCLTEYWRCLAFRSASREAAEYHRLLTHAHRRPPFLLFLIVHHPAVAEQLKKLPDCLLDPFTKRVLELFGFNSPDLRAFLLMLMHLGHTDTAKVECWHAWARRFLFRRGAQTHRPDFADLSARVFSHRLQRRQKAAAEWMPCAGAAGGASAQPGAEEPEGDRGQESEAKRRRGGGGAWRYFVGQHLRQGNGHASFAALADAYKERTDAEKAEHLAEGAVGTAMHKQGLPAFGPKKREAEALAIRREAVAFNRRHAIQDGSCLDSSAGAIAVSLPDHTSAHLKRLLAIIRAADAVERPVRQAEHKHDVERVQRFVAGDGAALLTQLLQVMPSLQACQSQLSAQPVSMQRDIRLGCFSFVSQAVPLAMQSVPLLVAASKSRGGGGGNLLSTLDSSWAVRHRPVCEGDWQGEAAPGTKETTPCYDAGFCVCCPQGRQVQLFRSYVLRVLKAMTTKGSNGGKLLDQGFMVLRFRGRPKESALAGLGGLDDELEGIDDVNVWWHCSFVLHTPYKPVMQAMCCPDLADELAIPDNVEVALQAIRGPSLHRDLQQLLAASSGSQPP